MFAAHPNRSRFSGQSQALRRLASQIEGNPPCGLLRPEPH